MSVRDSCGVGYESKRRFVFTGVRLGCILRCVYCLQGKDGSASHINNAATVARNEPSILDSDILGLLATEEFGYFYQYDMEAFGPIRDALWRRMAMCIKGLPTATPTWFSLESRLIDIIPTNINESGWRMP